MIKSIYIMDYFLLADEQSQSQVDRALYYSSIKVTYEAMRDYTSFGQISSIPLFLGHIYFIIHNTYLIKLSGFSGGDPFKRGTT